jgi:hypothetical protein
MESYRGSKRPVTKSSIRLIFIMYGTDYRSAGGIDAQLKPLWDPPKGVFDPPKGVWDPPKGVFDPPKSVWDPPKPPFSDPGPWDPTQGPGVHQARADFSTGPTYPKPQSDPPKGIWDPPKGIWDPPKPLWDPPKAIQDPKGPYDPQPKPMFDPGPYADFGVDRRPFVLQTPHHTMAWAGDDFESADAMSDEARIQGYEVALNRSKRHIDRVERYLESLRDHHDELREEYDRLSEAAEEAAADESG